MGICEAARTLREVEIRNNIIERKDKSVYDRPLGLQLLLDLINAREVLSSALSTFGEEVYVYG